MNFNDRIIANYESGVDDEYQAAIMHKSSTLAWHYVSYANLFLAALLAWLVPTNNTWIPLLATAPILIGAFASISWIKKHVPRPRAANLTPMDWALMILAGCLWLGGLYYNNTDATFATAAGYVTGALVGGVVGWSVMFWIQKRGRRQDEARLDAEYADD